MTTKLTIVLTSACVVCLYVLSLIIPNDPYFFFISSNSVVSLARVGLVVLMIYLSAKRRFKYRVSDSAISIVAVGLVGFGIAGLAVPSLDYYLYNVIKPFDYFYLIGSGTYVGYCSITIAEGRRRLHLPKLAQQMPIRLTDLLSRT